MQSSLLRQRSNSAAIPFTPHNVMNPRRGFSGFGVAIGSASNWSSLLGRKRRVIIPSLILTITIIWYLVHSPDKPLIRGSEPPPKPLDFNSLRELPKEDQWQPPQDWNPREELWIAYPDQNFTTTTAEFESHSYQRVDPYRRIIQDGSAAHDHDEVVSCVGPRGKRMQHNEAEWIHAYRGKLKNFPKQTFGMYEELDIDQDMCFDRFGKNRPYGYTDSSTLSPNMGSSDDEVEWDSVDWSVLQQQCIHDNRARFDFTARKRPEERGYQRNGPSSLSTKTKRTAILVRGFSEQEWYPELLVMLRSIIMEMAIGSGGEYEVFLLYHVKDVKKPIDKMSEKEVRHLIDSKVPPEFRKITVPWNEAMWMRRYPRVPFEGQLVHYGQWFPVQWFQKLHPEFDFYLNWETDIRYTGHYYELLDKSFEWAKKQKRFGLWERNARWFVPGYHKSYRNFAKHVDSRYKAASEEQHPDGVIWGPHRPFPKAYNRWWGPYREDYSRSWDPEVPKTVNHEWGVGEDADLVTFNPIFNPRSTAYSVAEFWYNYDERLRAEGGPSRRATIITFMRLSHRLLAMMEFDNTKGAVRHMASEQWPQAVSLYHGLKTVFVPHPIWMGKQWPAEAANFIFNNGDDQGTLDRNPELPRTGSGSGGPDSVFGLGREHNLFWQASFYYRAAMSMPLYRWFNGQNITSSNRRLQNDVWIGGPEWEAQQGGHYCLPPMLLHPIKNMAKEDPFP